MAQAQETLSPSETPRKASKIYQDLDLASWYLSQVLEDLGENPDYYGPCPAPTRQHIHRRVKRVMREIHKLAMALPEGRHVKDLYENGMPI